MVAVKLLYHVYNTLVLDNKLRNFFARLYSTIWIVWEGNVVFWVSIYAYIQTAFFKEAVSQDCLSCFSFMNRTLVGSWLTAYNGFAVRVVTSLLGIKSTEYYHPVFFICAWALPQAKKGQQKGRCKDGMLKPRSVKLGEL